MVWTTLPLTLFWLVPNTYTFKYLKKANNLQLHRKLSKPLPFSIFALFHSVSLHANEFVSIEARSWRWQQVDNIYRHPAKNQAHSFSFTSWNLDVFYLDSKLLPVQSFLKRFRITILDFITIWSSKQWHLSIWPIVLYWILIITYDGKNKNKLPKTMVLWDSKNMWDSHDFLDIDCWPEVLTICLVTFLLLLSFILTGYHGVWDSRWSLKQAVLWKKYYV